MRCATTKKTCSQSQIAACALCGMSRSSHRGSGDGMEPPTHPLHLDFGVGGGPCTVCRDGAADAVYRVGAAPHVEGNVAIKAHVVSVAPLRARKPSTRGARAGRGDRRGRRVRLPLCPPFFWRSRVAFPPGRGSGDTCRGCRLGGRRAAATKMPPSASSHWSFFHRRWRCLLHPALVHPEALVHEEVHEFQMPGPLVRLLK